MKKYLYLSSDIFNEKNPTNGAVILTYDTDSKQLSVIDFSENKKEEKIDIGRKNNENSISPELLAEYVSKGELQEVKSEFVEKIKGFFKIQGECTLEELETKDKVEGHWWQVGNKEYVYNGTDWVEVGFEIDLSQYAKKDELFSGSYNDLTDKPEIPSKTSELTNDAGFISSFTEEDPIFAAQSGQFATKDELTEFISDEIDPKFAEVSGLLALKSEIPTKTSELTNDSNFLTEHQSLNEYAKKSEIANLISEETDPKFAEVSASFATKDELTGFITEHQSLDDYATKDELINYATKNDIANMLTDEADPIFSAALAGLATKTNEEFGEFPESGYLKSGNNYTASGEIIGVSGESLILNGEPFRNNEGKFTSASMKLTNHSLAITGDTTIKSSLVEGPSGFETRFAYQLFTVNIGPGCSVSGMAAMAIGGQNKAIGHYAFANGYKTEASAAGSHAEGQSTYAKAGYSHVEGQNTETNASYSHAEGYRAKTYAQHSHAEGGTYTHNGVEYHPETYGKKSHAEGAGSKTYGEWSHAEGCMTAASGVCSHTEGWFTKAIGNHSHAEGYYCVTSGDFSHAIGHTAITDVTASGSFVEGFHTEAKEAYSHVEGKYNVPLAGYQHIVGGGSSDNDRKNIQTLDWQGNQVNAGNMTAKDFLFEGDDETLKEKITALLNRVAELEAIVSGLQQ